jgi:hypothetical protein
MLMNAPEGDLLAGDHDHPSGGGASLHPDRLGGGPRWWPRLSNTTQAGDLVGLQRVGPGAQHLAGVKVVERQRGRLDPDPDPASRPVSQRSTTCSPAGGRAGRVRRSAVRGD